MSNKVIFNFDELFISVGIDVGADFSWMSRHFLTNSS